MGCRKGDRVCRESGKNQVTKSPLEYAQRLARTVWADSIGNQITIASKTKDHIPIYHLTVTVDGRQLEIKAPFTRWFSADGYFVAKPFQQWLASEISVIGEADPNNVVEEIGRGNVVDGVRPEKVQDVLDQIRKGAATGSSPGSGKARRRG